MTSGVQQWVFQRVSNVVFIIFAVVLLKTILTQGLTYDSLNVLLDNSVFKVYALITLLFASANSILAGWQITGDYAAKFNIPPVLMMGVTIIVSVFYIVWGGMLLL
jgi:succinate dehydrogenase hydrophobic membrane anchor protein